MSPIDKCDFGKKANISVPKWNRLLYKIFLNQY
jgi:hypothetical protein